MLFDGVKDNINLQITLISICFLFENGLLHIKTNYHVLRVRIIKLKEKTAIGKPEKKYLQRL